MIRVRFGEVTCELVELVWTCPDHAELERLLPLLAPPDGYGPEAPWPDERAAIEAAAKLGGVILSIADRPALPFDQDAVY